MYGQQYLEWVEGEACCKELQGLLDKLASKHGDLAYAYAINKLFPRPVRSIGSVDALVYAQNRSLQMQAAGSVGGGNPFGVLGRGIWG